MVTRRTINQRLTDAKRFTQGGINPSQETSESLVTETHVPAKPPHPG